MPPPRTGDPFLTGAPAVVVPVAFDGSLPIAVQVVARPWHDHVALRVAQALEARARATGTGKMKP